MMKFLVVAEKCVARFESARPMATDATCDYPRERYVVSDENFFHFGMLVAAFKAIEPNARAGRIGAAAVCFCILQCEAAPDDATTTAHAEHANNFEARGGFGRCVIHNVARVARSK